MSPLQNGMIQFTALRNEGTTNQELPGLSVRFVRYPDSQQLVIWLPREVYTGYTRYMIRTGDREWEHDEVNTKINGTVQMLWDTILWPPANYTLEIKHNDGWYHVLEFLKVNIEEAGDPISVYDSGVINSQNFQRYMTELENEMEKLTQSRTVQDPEIMDGDGIRSQQVFTEDELKVRMKAEEIREEVFSTFLRGKEEWPRLHYEEQGKCGTIFYLDEKIRIPCYYELGGSPANLIVSIPTAENWEKQTGITLQDRRRILLFIATGVRREKAPSWRFEINDDSIVYYDA